MLKENEFVVYHSSVSSHQTTLIIDFLVNLKPLYKHHFEIKQGR
jgi:hypothetical protein